jgi:ABC-2 type transport system permease protein
MNRRTVRVTVLVWVKLICQAVMRDLQFRSQAWLRLASSVAELVIGILPVLILTSYAGSGPAISRASMLAVGIFAIATGLMDCFISPGLRRFDSAIRQGELDLAMIRPVPTFFYAVMRWIQPAELGKCLAGTAILIFTARTYDLGFHPYAVMSMLVWAIAGTVAYCMFWADLTLIAFWVRSIEPVNDLAAAWRSAGQYPRQFFPRTVQVILVSFAPAALTGSFPAQQLLEPTAALILAPVVLIASCSLTTLIWRRGIIRYNSASS